MKRKLAPCKCGGSYEPGGTTKNKPAVVSPQSAPLSASKKAAVFKKGGNTKKKYLWLLRKQQLSQQLRKA
jgi:hypothetical protein